MKSKSKWVVYLLALLTASVMMIGCGSDSGSSVTGGERPTVPLDEIQSVGTANCITCHSDSRFYPQTDLWLESAHASGSYGGTGSSCVACHNPNDDRHPLFSNNVVGCEACHGGGTAHRGVGPIPHPQPDAIATCAKCHTDLTARSRHLQNNPISNEIVERFQQSRHANQNARAGACSACHSHEGGVVLLAMDRFTSDADLKEAYNEDTVPEVFALPVGSSTINGVMKKNCATCHDPHSTALRGMGDILASTDNVVDFPVAAGVEVDKEVRVVYSAEFNLCAACHMVNLDATWNAAAGYNGRGMIEYELNEVYTAAGLAGTGTTTIDVSKVFYHDWTSGSGRMFTDTHFAGYVPKEIAEVNSVPFVEGSDDGFGNVYITGYNINPGDRNSCTICHDPHAASKMLAQGGSTTDKNPTWTDYDDNNRNDVVAYAQGMGKTHLNYIADVFSRNQSSASCTPCHTGRDFTRMAYGASISQLGSPRWNTLGCMTCHDLTPADTNSTDNAPNLVTVRTMPADFEFTFNSGVDLADTSAAVVVDGNNGVCFECHKGRSGAGDAWETSKRVYDVNYLHYSPSFATTVGAESGMYALYKDATEYTRGASGRANHTNDCTYCHDIHTPFNAEGKGTFEPRAGGLQTNLCNSCHYVDDPAENNYWRSFNVLRERTKVFGDTLFAAILAEVKTDAGSVDIGTEEAPEVVNYADFTSDNLKKLITNRGAASTMPTAGLAQAAAAWKNVMYDDKAGWAHNSMFARQLMFDALEDLGDEYLCALRNNAVTANIPVVATDKPITAHQESNNGTLLFGLGADRIATLNGLTCP